MSALMRLESVGRRFAIGSGLFARQRTLHAVQAVDLEIERGEVLAIVGESGCGKSTLAKLILGLLAPSDGRVLFEGRDVATMPRGALARSVQPVFQDPYSSLNPRQRVGEIVALPLLIQGVDPRERQRRAAAMLEQVGLTPRHAERLPSQLSGGQRQRVAIARALISNPSLVICDEPTSALDVSVQAQILNLLQSLRAAGDRTYVLISHNLAVVEHLATRVAVMYLGRIVELADAATLFRAPRHPYTRALLDSVLSTEPGRGIPDAGLGASAPDPMSPPAGCAFHPRCPKAVPQCSTTVPAPTTAGEGQTRRVVVCHLAHA
ncbi:MAG: ABC transporter ATP-binding protein [Lautropia sp.]